MDTVRPGVYFFKIQHGVWINTFYADGTGFADVRLTHDGIVDRDMYEFKWSMKGRAIIRVRTTEPNIKREGYELLLPDGKIQPHRGYKEGKLVTELPKDIGTMEFLGKPGHPQP